MRDTILKFILYARKHPEKKLHLQFTAFKALNCNQDFDWNFEGRKADLVQMLCEKQATKKEIIKEWKYYKKKLLIIMNFIT